MNFENQRSPIRACARALPRCRLISSSKATDRGPFCAHHMIIRSSIASRRLPFFGLSLAGKTERSSPISYSPRLPPLPLVYPRLGNGTLAPFGFLLQNRLRLPCASALLAREFRAAGTLKNERDDDDHYRDIALTTLTSGGGESVRYSLTGRYSAMIAISVDVRCSVS